MKISFNTIYGGYHLFEGSYRFDDAYRGWLEGPLNFFTLKLIYEN